MTRITRWWWIRHAPVTTAGGKLYGQRDMPADTSESAVEPEVFSGLASALPQPATWITTHLQRTHQTAEAIAAAGHKVPQRQIERDFVEQHFGDWQGRSWDELSDENGDALHKFWIAPAHHAPPGGESFNDVLARVGTAMDRLTETLAGSDIVVVAHGGSIRAAVAHALDLAPDRALAITVDNCSLTRIDHIDGPGEGGNWRLGAVNGRPGLNHV